MIGSIDKYCERISPDLWAEPFNIVSNLAYVIAGIFLVKLYRSTLSQHGWKYWDILVLIALIMCIGLGSSVWHIYATGWALYADAIPILLFINVYIISCLYRVVNSSILVIGALFLFYHLLNYSLQNYFDKDFLNGSIFYLPTGLFLLGISLFLLNKASIVGQKMLLASFIFIIALFFRTIDLDVCHTFSFGTHFIWHIISGYMMYLLVKILIFDKSEKII